MSKNYNVAILVDATLAAESQTHAEAIAGRLATKLLAETMNVGGEWMPMIDDTGVMRVVPQPDELVPVALTLRERDTILAALRERQYRLNDGPAYFGNRDAQFNDIAADSGPPLTTNEIDDLCERINR